MNLLWMFLFTVAVMQLSVFFTTIYLHRCLAHKALQLHPVVKNLMHLHLTLFTGIVPRDWVAVHRKHHHFSDKDGDPHSPYIHGFWKVWLGNAFYYRREARNPITVRKYTLDYRKDLIDRIPFAAWGALGGLMVFQLLYGWPWGGLLFVGQAAGYVLLNSTINSACHMIGYRNFDNTATNLRSVALITGGEGLHNNHHQYPASAKLAMKAGEWDPAWPAIRLLEKLGLAYVTPRPKARAA